MRGRGGTVPLDCCGAVAAAALAFWVYYILAASPAGGAGAAVYRLQTYMDAIATRYCFADFTPVNGVYDDATAEAVRRFQEGFGLPATGSTDRATYDAIYNYYLTLTEE